jgi:ATP:ADP antiporter, AAA family
MKDRLFKLLGIESGEESMVLILLTQSVFLGIFFGAFDISAHSFFLSIFDEKMMARGYVVSGLAGIILTSGYTLLQRRIPFRNFAIVNLFFVTLLTLLLWIILLLNPSKGVIFLVFIMLGPLNILAMLGFWGTASRLFTLRQGKRLFGLVDSGLIIGVIISCYAIPVLLSLNFKSHNILLISAGAVLTGSILQIMIRSRFRIISGKSEQETAVTGKKRSVIDAVREDPYVRIMGIFIALSVMTAFFVQYSFMAVTREQYPAEEDMARFLGLFTGSMMIFTLMIKLLVFSYLIRNYGLRTCLALSPILIAAFIIIAVIVGMIMGYSPASGGFMLFFMLLALSRLFSKALKDSIESPSFKVIYQTIDEKIRYETQSGMDGTVNEIAALTSGLLLAGLGILSFIKLIHFSIVLFLITIVWIYVAVKLYSGYRNSIRKALETGKQINTKTGIQPEESNLKNRFSVEMIFKRNYFSLVSGDFKCLEKNSIQFYSKVLENAENRKDINLLPAVKKIATLPLTEKEIRKNSDRIAESLELLLSPDQQKDDKNSIARKILSDSRQPQTTQILRLLRDNSLESKTIAIYMIGKFKMTDMLPEVCACLSIPGLETQAASVLRSIGKNADEELYKYYMVSSGNLRISKMILRLLGEDAGTGNQGFLFARLWSNSREIKEIALQCLIDHGFKSADEDKDRLHQLISDIIGIMVWNLSAKICLERRNETLLSEALNMEISRWNAFLFNILSITYDSGSIGRIRENLENGTVESINYALEMIDMVIDESIKPKLIPLLDVIPDEEKVRNLFQFFPGEIPDYQKLVEDIINRDYNLLGIWIRTCAIRNLPGIESRNLAESLVALLFSPATILQEESARLLTRSDDDQYKSASERIPVQVRKHINRIFRNETSQEELIYEKVRFLSKYFKEINEENLIFLAEAMIYTENINETVLPANGGYVVWSGEPENVEIIHESQGSPAGKLQQEKERQFHILPLDSVEEYHNQFPEQAYNILNFIEINEK